MSVEQKDFIKKNWLTMANLIFLITLSFKVGVVITALEDSIKANKEFIISHSDNSSLHMPFSEKIKVFVPRVELNSKLENLSKQLDRIEKKLD